MSKIDQAFVKAFAKRPQPSEPVVESPVVEDLAALASCSFWVDSTGHHGLRPDEAHQLEAAASGRSRGSRPAEAVDWVPSPAEPPQPMPGQPGSAETPPPKPAVTRAVEFVRFDPRQIESAPTESFRNRLSASEFTPITVAHDVLEEPVIEEDPRDENIAAEQPLDPPREEATVPAAPILRIDAGQPIATAQESTAGTAEQAAAPLESELERTPPAAHEDPPAAHEDPPGAHEDPPAADKDPLATADPQGHPAPPVQPSAAEAAEVPESSTAPSQPIASAPTVSTDANLEGPATLPISEAISPAVQAAEKKRFEAAWEVDQFDAPRVLHDLMTTGNMISEAGMPLATAVRDGLQRVLITSATAGAGRSTMAMGLAMAAASTGLRVALIDGDIDRPTLVDDLQLELEFGWPEAIRGGVALSETAVHSVQDGVTLFPVIPANLGAPANGHELARVLDQLAGDFDLLLVDGPVGGHAMLAESFQSAILVRDMRQFDRQAIDRTIAELTQKGFANLGIAENFA